MATRGETSPTTRRAWFALVPVLVLVWVLVVVTFWVVLVEDGAGVEPRTTEAPLVKEEE